MLLLKVYQYGFLSNNLLTILDLTNLQIINYGNYALQCDNHNSRKVLINGNESYNNKLVMRSKYMLVWKCNYYLDLPVLNSICCGNGGLHQYTGHVLLDSKTQTDN